MATKKKKIMLMRAVSELKKADYSPEPELGGIYQRLANGRKQFAEVFEKGGYILSHGNTPFFEINLRIPDMAYLSYYAPWRDVYTLREVYA